MDDISSQPLLIPQGRFVGTVLSSLVFCGLQIPGQLVSVILVKRKAKIIGGSGHLMIDLI
jgi:hypothetical protein